MRKNEINIDYNETAYIDIEKKDKKAKSINKRETLKVCVIIIAISIGLALLLSLSNKSDTTLKNYPYKKIAAVTIGETYYKYDIDLLEETSFELENKKRIEITKDEVVTNLYYIKYNDKTFEIKSFDGLISLYTLGNNLIIDNHISAPMIINSYLEEMNYPKDMKYIDEMVGEQGFSYSKFSVKDDEITITYDRYMDTSYGTLFFISERENFNVCNDLNKLSYVSGDLIFSFDFTFKYDETTGQISLPSGFSNIVKVSDIQNNFDNSICNMEKSFYTYSYYNTLSKEYSMAFSSTRPYERIIDTYTCKKNSCIYMPFIKTLDSGEKINKYYIYDNKKFIICDMEKDSGFYEKKLELINSFSIWDYNIEITEYLDDGISIFIGYDNINNEYSMTSSGVMNFESTKIDIEFIDNSNISVLLPDGSNTGYNLNNLSS